MVDGRVGGGWEEKGGTGGGTKDGEFRVSFRFSALSSLLRQEIPDAIC